MSCTCNCNRTTTYVIEQPKVEPKLAEVVRQALVARRG
jgi:hypothetical protein